MLLGGWVGGFAVDNYAVTIDLLKKAEILSKHHPSEKATTLNNLACYYRRLGKLHAAMTCLKRALEIEKKLQNVRNAADTHLNICAVLSQLGKHQEALEQAQQALIILQEEFFLSRQTPTDTKGASKAKAESKGAEGSSHSLSSSSSQQLDRVSVMCIAYHNIGVEQEFLKDYANSVVSYKKGVGLAEQYLGVDHAITTTVRNSYLAAKRTISTKPSAGRHGSGSGAESSSPLGSKSSPGKVPLRLISSPRSGGSAADALRLPSPLTKEKQRHNHSDVPTPRSIVAEVLSRGSTLPPLEVGGAASSPGRGVLSPRDPFFSPRFRFNDSKSIGAASVSDSASKSPRLPAKAKKKKEVKFQSLPLEEEEVKEYSASPKENSYTKPAAAAKTETSDASGILVSLDAAQTPPGGSGRDRNEVDSRAAAEAATIQPAPTLDEDHVLPEANDGSARSTPVEAQQSGLIDSEADANGDPSTSSAALKLTAAASELQESCEVPTLETVLGDPDVDDQQQLDNTDIRAADSDDAETTRESESGSQVTSPTAESSVSEGTSESQDKDDILGLLDESAGDSQHIPRDEDTDTTASLEFAHHDVEAEPSDITSPSNGEMEVHDASEGADASLSNSSQIEGTASGVLVNDAAAECDPEVHDTMHQDDAGIASSDVDGSIQRHEELLAADGSHEDAGTESLYASGRENLEAIDEGADHDSSEFAVDPAVQHAEVEPEASDGGAKREDWGEQQHVGAHEEQTGEHESWTETSQHLHHDDSESALDADKTQYPLDSSHDGDSTALQHDNDAAAYYYDAVAYYTDEQYESRDPSPDPQYNYDEEEHHCDTEVATDQAELSNYDHASRTLLDEVSPGAALDFGNGMESGVFQPVYTEHAAFEGASHIHDEDHPGASEDGLDEEHLGWDAAALSGVDPTEYGTNIETEATDSQAAEVDGDDLGGAFATGNVVASE